MNAIAGTVMDKLKSVLSGKEDEEEASIVTQVI